MAAMTVSGLDRWSRWGMNSCRRGLADRTWSVTRQLWRDRYTGKQIHTMWQTHKRQSNHFIHIFILSNISFQFRKENKHGWPSRYRLSFCDPCRTKTWRADCLISRAPTSPTKRPWWPSWRSAYGSWRRSWKWRKGEMRKTDGRFIRSDRQVEAYIRLWLVTSLVGRGGI